MTWEYRADWMSIGRMDESLDGLGADCWELVATPMVDHEDRMVYCIFKRRAEDARDAARYRFLRDGWPRVLLGWLDVETGNFGGEHGDLPLYARTPSVEDHDREVSWEGDTPDEAVDAAMHEMGFSAVSPSEGTNNEPL